MAFIIKAKKLVKSFFTCFCDNCGHEFDQEKKPNYFGKCPSCNKDGFINFREVKTEKDLLDSF